MSLIPFIIDLADELHELGRCLANGIDIDDFGFGMYAGSGGVAAGTGGGCNEHVQSSPQHQQNARRSRATPFYWLPSKRHHPYCRSKPSCCHKLATEVINACTPTEKESTAAGAGSGIAEKNFLNNSSSTNESGSGSSSTGTLNVSGISTGKSAAYSVVNRNGFQVSMNVKQFAPNELSVKTINNCIVVEGRHDDKEDGHGVISRHFVRKYMLPKGYDPNDVTSTLSSDGILTVRAPPPPPPIHSKNSERNERIVEIQPFSGPAQLVSSPTPLAAAAAAKEKDNVKEPAKCLSTINSSPLNQMGEKKLKLDQTAQKQQLQKPTDDNIVENKLNEILRDEREEREQPQSQLPQCMLQQQQQSEHMDTKQKTIQNLQHQHYQEKLDENSMQLNNVEKPKQKTTDAVIAALNIDHLQRNGETKPTDIVMSVNLKDKIETEAETVTGTMLKSSIAIPLAPEKAIEVERETKNLINSNHNTSANTNKPVQINLNDVIVQNDSEDEQLQQQEQQSSITEITGKDAKSSKMETQIASVATPSTTTAATLATVATTPIDNNELILPLSGTELSSVSHSIDKGMMILSDATLNVKIATQNVNPLTQAQAMVIDYKGGDHGTDHVDDDIEMETTAGTLSMDCPTTTATKTEPVEDKVAVLNAVVMTSNVNTTNATTSNTNNKTNYMLEDGGPGGVQNVCIDSNISNVLKETATVDNKEYDELFIKSHLINSPAKMTLTLPNNKEITN